jgi:hypothetical protein
LPIRSTSHAKRRSRWPPSTRRRSRTSGKPRQRRSPNNTLGRERDDDQLADLQSEVELEQGPREIGSRQVELGEHAGEAEAWIRPKKNVTDDAPDRKDRQEVLSSAARTIVAAIAGSMNAGVSETSFKRRQAEG